MSRSRKILGPIVLALGVTGLLGGSVATAVAPVVATTATYYHNTPRVLADGATYYHN